ncbi:MAG: SPASM domain-containing protein [candidate division Zixibacteria bacterium]
MLELKKTKLKDIGFSVVICDKNVSDLIALYELSVWLGVEFAQSTMHNSWYFHTTDNEIADRNSVAAGMERFMTALLTSKRRGLKMRVKDWLRAYFNQRLYHYATTGYSYQRNCTAGSDIFFLDPYGNITPCNGSDSKWIMGNLKNQSFDEIWNSPDSDKIRKMVSTCSKDCAFIGTARFDMMRNPFATARWVMKNKLRAMRGLPLCIGSDGDGPAGVDLEEIPVVERKSQKKLVIR